MNAYFSANSLEYMLLNCPWFSLTISSGIPHLANIFCNLPITHLLVTGLNSQVTGENSRLRVSNSPRLILRCLFSLSASVYLAKELVSMFRWCLQHNDNYRNHISRLNLFHVIFSASITTFLLVLNIYLNQDV